MPKLSYVLVALVVGSAIGYYVGYDHGFEKAVPPGDGGGIACTADAKLCPDGSYVGRVSPKCEFAQCPNPSGTSGIRGVVLLGPACPVERVPPDPQCAEKKYATNLAVTTPEGAQVVKSFSSGSDGTFTVPLAPGEYTIRSAAAANVLPYCASNAITVKANAYTETTVHCDTGIR